MFGVGFVLAALGLFLADSAIQGRSPIDTLKAIISDPGNISATLADTKGVIALTTSPGTVSDGVAASPDAAGTGGTSAASYDSGSASSPAPSGANSYNAITGKWGVTHHPLTSDKVIAFARAQIGKPYRWGATGPSAYDCSGLVQAAFKAAGISLPRTTAQMVFKGTAVRKADLQPGDIVFPDAGHVQIYSGSGKVIESPHTGLKVREVPMWGFWTARRIIK